ncbi:hypothetical protein PHMEG_00032931, partial [Phytophthora megakarya]
MSKARFGRIMQNLHFSDNADPWAETDRARKVRPVVKKLQQTFREGYNVPTVVAFVEAMITLRSRQNIMRQYLNDKPHKWGTKLFMTCCAYTAYCLRCVCVHVHMYLLLGVCIVPKEKSRETFFWLIFCGKDQHTSELGGDSPTRFLADPNAGPAAVVRKLHEVLPPPEPGVYHAVVTDRFYTSLQLSLQLLSHNVYSIGTIQANRMGYPNEVTTEHATRPCDVPHGSAKMA